MKNKERWDDYFKSTHVEENQSLEQCFTDEEEAYRHSEAQQQIHMSYVAGVYCAMSRINGIPGGVFATGRTMIEAKEKVLAKQDRMVRMELGIAELLLVQSMTPDTYTVGIKVA